MNSRFTLLASSIAIAVLSLALFISVVGGTASSVRGEAIGIEADAVTRDSTDNRLLAYQRPDIHQNELLSLTEPISIYLPLLENEYIKYPEERAALMALYISTNGGRWRNNSGWGTNSYHCGWYGVTCDENAHVTALDLGGNGLTGTLPSNIGNLPMLTILRLTGTKECNKGGCVYDQLGDPLPPEIGNLANLQELNLSYNLFTTLPADLGNLVSLQELYLGGNQFTTLPAEIGNLTNLQMLDLSWNHLTSLPTEISNLVNLQVLNLLENYLTSIPPEIDNLASLQELYLGGNQFTTLPAEIGNLTNLQMLDLSWNHLTSLPTEISNLVNLQVLNLLGNYFTSIPPEIGNLASLQELYLGGNQFTTLPAEIGNLTNLQMLDLSWNHLTSLPTEISNLVNLQVLNLFENYFTSIPPEIGNLASLLVLRLEFNQLSGIIPAWLSNLDNLTWLGLGANPNLTCWETQQARDWTLSLHYDGPTCFIPINIFLPSCFRS